MRESNFYKYMAMAALGTLVPGFLLLAPAASAAAVTVPVVFAAPVGQGAGQWLDLPGTELLFGGGGLPDTYRAQATPSQLAAMSADPALLYAQPDRLVSAARIRTDDPYFTTDDEDGDKQWYLPRIRIPKAWEYGRGSDSVKVAIIDTGIHSSHLELNDGRVLSGYDATTGRDIPADSDSDDNGHGTAVAGVIGAIPDNGKGIAGINWDIGLVPVKALEADGTGRISHVADAIVWAADNGVDVINISLGGPGFGKDMVLHNAIIHAFGKGVVVVAAAGNDLAEHGISLDSKPVYPICADGEDNMVIGVAATDENDRKAAFSNYGSNCVDISAPGKKILTTAFLPSEPSNNILIYGSGTSLATPMVSGVAALLKSNNPRLTNREIRDIILHTSDNIDGLNQASCQGSSCNGYLGEGRLNALSALSPQPLLDGTLVRKASNGDIYMIFGGEKRFVNAFVFRQRGFSDLQVVNEANGQLSDYHNGEPLAPSDSSLVKSSIDPTVYYVLNGELHAVSYFVFQSRKFSFADVLEMGHSELSDLKVGRPYWPADGILLKSEDAPAVYLMQDGVKRPVSESVFTQRGFSYADIVVFPPGDFMQLPNAPDKYWLSPLEGSLLKPQSADQVYLVVDSALRPLSGTAFAARGLRFGDIRTIQDYELPSLLTGPPILN